MACLDTFNVVRKSQYCGGPTVALDDWLWPRESPIGFADSWPQLEGRTVIGTHRGRTAVALACRLLGLGEGHEVLVPAYNCGTEVDAMQYMGVTPVGYRISRQCGIDLDDLIARKTSRTRAVFLIHYFGWEQPMVHLRHWCDEQGLLLIEDCALALFSSGPSGGIGRTGDAAIYSLPKSLGFLHGGLLSLSARTETGSLRLKPSETATWLREIRHSARSMAFLSLERLGVYGMLVSAHRRRRSRRMSSAGSEGLADMPDGYYFNPALDADRVLHPKVEAILDLLPWPRIVRARRDNYLRLAGALEDVDGVKLLFPQLPPCVCPLSLPVLVSNRDQCASILQARGIAAFPWWAGFHRGDLDWTQFPEACWLKHNVLTVPVYQGMEARQLDEMAAWVAEVLQRDGNPL